MNRYYYAERKINTNKNKMNYVNREKWCRKVVHNGILGTRSKIISKEPKKNLM